MEGEVQLLWLLTQENGFMFASTGAPERGFAKWSLLGLASYDCHSTT